MIRIKDHAASLKFYKEIMGKLPPFPAPTPHTPQTYSLTPSGMTLLRTSENASNKFNLYFLGYAPPNPTSTSHHEGLLELTWNYGTENDASFAYHNGNTDPQGFGHICVSVDDLDAACKRFEEKGVQWKKRLTEGRMRNVAFVLDPDGYWIEVIQNEKLKPTSNW